MSGFGACRTLLGVSLIHFVVSLLSQLKHILGLADQCALASTLECVRQNWIYIVVQKFPVPDSRYYGGIIRPTEFSDGCLSHYEYYGNMSHKIVSC